MSSVTAVPPEFKSIPVSLRNLNSWVCWRYELRDGKWTKVPINAKTGKCANTTNPATWATFEDAKEAYKLKNCDGIGFVFAADDPYVGIDFDNCIVNKRIAPEVSERLKDLDTYWEMSPSQKGIKAWAKGKFPGRGRKVKADWKDGQIEMYQESRFFTVMGAGKGTISESQDAIDTIYDKYFKSDGDGQATKQTTKQTSVALEDDQILKLVRRAKNADKFSELFDDGNGDVDLSVRDAALIGIFAFYTQDVDQLERLMNLSPLPRDKWDEKRGNETWLRYTIINILAKGGARYTPPQVPKVKIKPSRYGLCASDADARRLAEMYLGKLKFDVKRKEWIIWTEKRWETDKIGIIRQYALSVRRWIFAEAKLAEADPNIKSEETRLKRAAQLHNWAIKLGNKARINDLLLFAQSLPGMYVTPDELDSNPMLLNCLNGTLDLATGELRKYDPADLITKLCPVNYDENAQSDVWDKFIGEATGDAKDFVQRAAGYSLTGITNEDLIFFVCGPPGTGKSTFVSALRFALGDYAVPTDFEAFVKKRYDVSTRPEIARLPGARFVPSIEIEDGREIAAALLSNMSGGDPVVVRGLFQAPFEFVPTHKLWIVANQAPVVPPGSSGIWRRLLKIPFDFKPENPEKSVRDELTDPEQSGAAILAWAVKGCLAWQALKVEQLDPPDCVKVATAEYKAESNPVAEFLEACCIPGDDDCKLLTAQLWKVYQRWREVEGLRSGIRGSGPLWRAIQLESKYRHIHNNENKTIRISTETTGKGYKGITLSVHGLELLRDRF